MKAGSIITFDSNFSTAKTTAPPPCAGFWRAPGEAWAESRSEMANAVLRVFVFVFIFSLSRRDPPAAGVSISFYGRRRQVRHQFEQPEHDGDGDEGEENDVRAPQHEAATGVALEAAHP